MTIRAVFIGVDQYDDPAIPPLYGCRTDVARWFAYLGERVTSDPDAVRVLTSPRISDPAQLGQTQGVAGFAQQVVQAGNCWGASRKEILAAFDWLVEGLEAGQRGLLFYAGYGTLIAAGKRGVEGARAICPSDTKLEAQEITERLQVARAAPIAARRRRRRKGPSRAIATTRTVQSASGAIPLPDQTMEGRELRAGHALDKVRDLDKPPYADLTTVLDTSFTVFSSPPRVQSRSLPIVGAPAKCLPVYELGSRTICAARPGQEALEAMGSGGSLFSQAMTLALYQKWGVAQAANGARYSQVTHETLVAETRQVLSDLSATQQPTLAGHRNTPITSFLCGGLGCDCRGGDVDATAHWLAPWIQISAGENDFRGYDVEILTNGGPGTPATWKRFAQLLVAAVDSEADPQAMGASTAGTAAGTVGARSAAPGSFPRNYLADTEYWRTLDDEVAELFAAAQQGRLLGMRFVSIRDGDWDVDTSDHAAWLNGTFEAGTRKRQCGVYPPWPAVPLVPAAGPGQVVAQATLNGEVVCLRFVQDATAPGVLARVAWYHARAFQLPKPTFFGNLTVGQSAAFSIVAGGGGPPPGYANWFCADTPLQALPGDP